MSYRRLAEALLQGHPYFGPCLRSLQGLPERQRCFLPVVKCLAKGASLEILEIGSWAGASSISWASALRELGLGGHVTCVDPWLPYFDLEKEGAGLYAQMNRAAKGGLIYQLFRHNVSSSGFSDTILIKKGASRTVLPNMEPHSFDIVYMDGSHLFEDVSFDLQEVKRLIRPGGIVCGDDLEIQLNELPLAEVEAAAATGLDYVPGANGLSYHPGVTLAVGREIGPITAWNGFWAVRRSSNQWCPVILDMTESPLPEHLVSAVIQEEGEMPEYHLISAEQRYFGLAKQLGPIDVAAELLDECDLPPLMFTGATLEEVRQKICRTLEQQAAATLQRPESPQYPEPVLVGDYRAFNLVRFRTDCFGLRQSLGPMDVSLDPEITARYGPHDCVRCESVEGVKARIDAIEAERAFECLVTRLRELIRESDPGANADQRPA